MILCPFFLVQLLIDSPFILKSAMVKEDKLYGHPSYKGRAQCGTVNQLHTENSDYSISAVFFFQALPMSLKPHLTGLKTQPSTYKCLRYNLMPSCLWQGR